MRGLPGNSINHINSYFAPSHTSRLFVEGEVDMVGGVGYNSRAPCAPGTKQDFVDLRLIVTNLCVTVDFGGPENTRSAV